MEHCPIGFVGQGVVGKAIADDFEARGFTAIRYSLENPHIANKDRIRECEVVFVAVPTPSTPELSFDESALHNVLKLLAPKTLVVIKSTTLPGTVERLDEKFIDLRLISSPEFLNAVSAGEDAACPAMNIIGMASSATEADAAMIASILPVAKHVQYCTSDEAELIKYTHNIHGVFRIMLANIMYDAAQAIDADFHQVQQAMDLDPYMNEKAFNYNEAVHDGSVDAGRGAGGHCFIKDLRAFRSWCSKHPGTRPSGDVIYAIESHNNKLLRESGKDINILKTVYLCE